MGLRRKPVAPEPAAADLGAEFDALVAVHAQELEDHHAAVTQRRSVVAGRLAALESEHNDLTQLDQQIAAHRNK